MQLSLRSIKLSFKTILLFFTILIIAFLPISSFLFFIKNDAFINYFPPKLFISESLKSGFLPLWNPYINFGFPQYGDMNSGFWSPITWLISISVGYNAYSFTIELLLYILVGGLGMYKATGIFNLAHTVRVISGVAFMCCGYNLGHLQHFNWISGAAFLPWCLWSYLILLNKFSLKNCIQAAVLFYLLIASSHPGIIISAIYFFGVVCIFSFASDKDKLFKMKIKSFGVTHLVFLILVLLLSAGLIAGYSDIVPNFIRGEKIGLNDSLSNPTNLKSWISVLLPFATVKNDSFYNTDPSMRNCYFSLTLLLFFLLACIKQKDRWQKFLLGTGVAFALLSLGGIFKTFAYNFIPLIGYVRLNGEFRIFSLLCFILVAAIEFHKFIQHKNKFEGAIVWIYYLIELITVALIIFGLYQSISSRESFLFTKSVLITHGTVQRLKDFIDAISFYDTFWIEGSIQLLFLWGIKWCLRNSNWAWLQRLTIVNLIITCLLNIPYTGAGKASVQQVQSVLNQAPQRIITPVLQPIIRNDTLSKAASAMIGNWSMYSKQIGVKEEVSYPIILKNMRAYFQNLETNADSAFLNKPFLFTTSSLKDSIFINRFSPDEMKISVIVQEPVELVLQQNFYPHWYYKNDTERKIINQHGINFMSVPVQKGINNITISFEPAAIKIAMIISLVSFLCCCILLLLFWFKSKPPSPS
ncbi:MAG: hypothetical protein ABIN67_19250 [Ferruginibacter sp.]